MQVKKIAEMELINSEKVKNFSITIDFKNKLMFFAENDGANEPSVCLSLDALTDEAVDDVKIKGVE
jgi:hypothetical protein